MKICKQLVFFVFLLTSFLFSSITTASEWRQGVSVGGTHMVGYDLEIPLGPMQLETSLGLWELALTASETIKQYHRLEQFNFFYGGGLWQVIAITPDEGGMINMIRAVIGAEWPLNPDTVWGLELGINYPYPDKGRRFWGGEPNIEFNKKVPIPLPRFYYRWTF